MKILGTRILIKPTPITEKNGILLPVPDNHYGEVIAVGEKQTHIKIGDKIKYHEGRGTEYDGKVFLDENDVDVILD